MANLSLFCGLFLFFRGESLLGIDVGSQTQRYFVLQIIRVAIGAIGLILAIAAWRAVRRDPQRGSMRPWVAAAFCLIHLGFAAFFIHMIGELALPDASEQWTFESEKAGVSVELPSHQWQVVAESKEHIELANSRRRIRCDLFIEPSTQQRWTELGAFVEEAARTGESQSPVTARRVSGRTKFDNEYQLAGLYDRPTASCGLVGVVRLAEKSKVVIVQYNASIYLTSDLYELQLRAAAELGESIALSIH